jgi:hypothetical protein
MLMHDQLLQSLMPWLLLLLLLMWLLQIPCGWGWVGHRTM